MILNCVLTSYFQNGSTSKFAASVPMPNTKLRANVDAKPELEQVLILLFWQSNVPFNEEFLTYFIEYLYQGKK